LGKYNIHENVFPKIYLFLGSERDKAEGEGYQVVNGQYKT
jgi:hypothetical protein